MSRIFTLGILAVDATATVSTLLTSFGLIAALLLSVFTSVALALTSATLQSVLWPTYFWDDATAESEC